MIPYLAAITLSFLAVATLNFRALTEYTRELAHHDELNETIENLTDENLNLQEEIHYLKTDPKRIATEARKLGLRPRKEKVAEPAK